MKSKMLTRITNIICAVLLVATFASLFLPSWDYTATVKIGAGWETKEVEENASVMEFTWMAHKNKDLNKQFKKDGYEVNEVVLMPFVLTLCTIAGVISCLANMNGSWQSLFPLIGGGMGVFALLTNKVLQQGPYWMVNLILSILLLVAALVLFIVFVKQIIDWFVVKHPRL